MKYLLLIPLLLFFLRFGSPVAAADTIAANYPVPSAHCLSSKPCTSGTPSTAVPSTTVPSGTYVSGQPNSSAAPAAPSANPQSPSTTSPCSTSQSAVSSHNTGGVYTMSNKNQAKQHPSVKNGLIQQIISLIIKIILLLLQHLGIQIPSTNPCIPNLSPSGAPLPSVGGGGGGAGAPSTAPGNGAIPTIYGTSPAPSSAAPSSAAGGGSNSGGGSTSGSNTPPVTRLGIWIGGAENNGTFATVQGQKPDVANTYVGWEQSWPSGFVSGAAAAGATPFIELEPWNDANGNSTPQFSDIIAGKYDSWLTSIGNSAKSFGKPVIFTFAHEFNVSGQYPWAVGDTGSCGGSQCSPAQWIQAWDHVESVVNKAAGTNAFWMWCPNVDSGGSNTNPVAWWPGASEVQMVGVDGYPSFINPSGGTFQSGFGQTFSEIHTKTNLPIFIAETNLAPLGSGGFESIPNFIHDLFAAGGDGILEFEEGGPSMSSSQWSQLDAALAKYPN